MASFDSSRRRHKKTHLGECTLEELTEKLEEADSHLGLLKKSVDTLQGDIARVAVFDDEEAADMKRRNLAVWLEKKVHESMMGWQDGRDKLHTQLDRRLEEITRHADECNRILKIRRDKLSGVWDAQPSMVGSMRAWGGPVIAADLHDTMASHIAQDGTLFVAVFDEPEFRGGLRVPRLAQTASLLEGLDDFVTSACFCGFLEIVERLIFVGTAAGSGIVAAIPLDESKAPRILARRHVCSTRVASCAFAEETGRIVTVSEKAEVAQWNIKLEAKSLQIYEPDSKEWGATGFKMEHISLCMEDPTHAVLATDGGRMLRVTLPQHEPNFDENGQVVSVPLLPEIILKEIWGIFDAKSGEDSSALFPGEAVLPRLVLPRLVGDESGDEDAVAAAPPRGPPRRTISPVPSRPRLGLDKKRLGGRSKWGVMRSRVATLGSGFMRGMPARRTVEPDQETEGDGGDSTAAPPEPEIPESVTGTNPITSEKRRLNVRQFKGAVRTTAVLIAKGTPIMFTGNAIGEVFLWDIGHEKGKSREVVGVCLPPAVRVGRVWSLCVDEKAGLLLVGHDSEFRVFDVLRVFELLRAAQPDKPQFVLPSGHSRNDSVSQDGTLTSLAEEG